MLKKYLFTSFLVFFSFSEYIESSMLGFKMPEDISEHGHLITWLFEYTTFMNIIFFVLLCVGLFGFSFLYSQKRHPKPYYTYGNKKVHVIIATLVGVSVFFGVDLNISRISNNDFLGVFINWPKKMKMLKRFKSLHNNGRGILDMQEKMVFLIQTMML